MPVCACFAMKDKWRIWQSCEGRIADETSLFDEEKQLNFLKLYKTKQTIFERLL